MVFLGLVVFEISFESGIFLWRCSVFSGAGLVHQLLDWANWAYVVRVFSKCEAVHFQISLLFWTVRETPRSSTRERIWLLASSTVKLFFSCTSSLGTAPFDVLCVHQVYKLMMLGQFFLQELMKDDSGKSIFLLLLHLLRSSFHFWRHPPQCQIKGSKPLLIAHCVLTGITNPGFFNH